MSPRDIKLLQKRLDVHNGFIKAQHKLPKALRDQPNIDKTMKIVDRINGWLNEKKPALAQSKAISKAAFRENYKKEFDIKEPDQIIQIHTLKDLDEAWPNIIGKNITVEAPPEVKAEITRRIKKLREKQKMNGFR